MKPLLALLLWAASPLAGQGVLERSPNLQGVWGLEGGRGAFVLSHRFEVFEGGDELASIPTLTLAAGLPLRLTAGIDFTSFSEVVPDKLAGNELQYWLKRPFGAGPVRAAAIVAYNTAAESVDGAVDLALRAGRFDLFAEGRAFSDLFGRGEGGAAAAVGGALRVTQFIALVGDVGRVVTGDRVPAAWSGALAMEIPASPHTLSLQVTNTGATTLQGASREKAFGSRKVRYGFTFSVALGGSGRWSRLFDPVAPAPGQRTETADEGIIRVDIRDFTYAPGEIRIRTGETVEWTNLDAVGHTVTSSGREWDSGLLLRGDSYRRTFEEPGTYDYYCTPHPVMTGRVVVEG